MHSHILARFFLSICSFDLVYTTTLLHPQAFTPHFYTKKLLHQPVITHLHNLAFYTTSFTPTNFYTRKLLHHPAFTPTSLCTNKHTTTPGHKFLYPAFTQTHLTPPDFYTNRRCTDERRIHNTKAFSPGPRQPEANLRHAKVSSK